MPVESPAPYLPRQNGNLITAEDWNDIQSMGRTELYARGARLLEGGQVGDVVEEDGVPVVRQDVDSSAWVPVAGLAVELVL